MIEPFIGQQVRAGHILQDMLGQDQCIAAKIVFKRRQSGRILGFHRQRLLIHYLDAFNGRCILFDHAVIADTHDGVHRKGDVGALRVSRNDQSELHVFSRNRCSVTPHGIVLETNREVKVVLCGNGLSQDRNKVQFPVCFHERLEDQGSRILDDLSGIHGHGIERGNRAGHANIDRFFILCRGQGDHREHQGDCKEHRKDLFHR